MFDFFDIGGLLFKLAHFLSETVRTLCSALFLFGAFLFVVYTVCVVFFGAPDQKDYVLLGIALIALVLAVYHKWYYGQISGIDVESLKGGDHNFPARTDMYRFSRKRHHD